MRIIKYLKQAKGTVALIVCLLIVQAFTDLALPTLTSDIVDVGIQQSGVEHVATEELRDETFQAVAMMLSDEDEATLRSCYDQTEEGTWALNETGEELRDELDSLMALPMVVVAVANGDIAVSTDEDTGEEASTLSLSTALAAYEAGLITKDQVQEALAEVTELLSSYGDSIVEQQGIVAATAEYEALGYDLDDIQLDYLLSTGARMLGLAALGMVVAIIVGFLASRTGTKIAYNLRSRLFERVVSFSDQDVNHFSAASLITRGTNDIMLIQNVTVMFLRMVLYAPILAIGGIIMITQTNVSLAWIIVVAVIGVVVLIGVLFSAAMPKFKLMQKLIDKVNLVAREILTGLPVIRAFGRERYEEKRFDKANDELMRTQLFTNRVMAFMQPGMTLIMNCVSVAIVWFGGLAVEAGTLQTGQIIAFITYAMVIIMGFLMIGMIAIMLPRADVAAGRIDEVLAFEPTIKDPDAPRDAELPAREEAPGARLTFDDVTFCYGESEAPAVAHVSFEVEPGTTCAIIGTTGSGKSTVVKLAERFLDATEGSVRIDGIDVRELSQHAVHTTLGYVPQKAFLFSGTVESNVAYSAGTMPSAQVNAALSIAQATGFVSDMPGGTQAQIAQGGTNVSGGQRQRLAIARALATPARAFIFDDSFSALDYKTDAALRHELSTKLSGTTVVIVAQRIATIMHADNIIVLDQGRVVGQGTHRELMESCEEYREIAYSQLSAEELEGGDAA